MNPKHDDFQATTTLTMAPTSSSATTNRSDYLEEYQALLAAASTTAGSDSWKTCAGRLDGPDGFVFPGDAFRCMKNALRRGAPNAYSHLKKSGRVVRDASGTRVCPVCLEDPTSQSNQTNETRDGDGVNSNGWYTTLSCHHSVCRDCLRSYAHSLISDPSHSGPLKCPCCPRLLRVEDARVALSDPELDESFRGRKKQSRKLISHGGRSAPLDHVDRERCVRNSSSDSPDRRSSALSILEKWDKKVRDEFLRSMPEFRPCPHCGNKRSRTVGSSDDEGAIHSGLIADAPIDDNSGIGAQGGGGFVTPECLAPINEERESSAERLLGMAVGSSSAKIVLFAYSAYYLAFCHQLSSSQNKIPSTGTISNTRHSITPLVSYLQITLSILPVFLIPILPHAIRLLLAKLAKQQLLRPILVTCPCCHQSFHLDSSSEFQLAESSSPTLAESASQHWKQQHTRPCPGCSSPILKDGGCNHVRCSRCRVEFCWACMRTRTRCAAYQCRNGAPYGNAFGNGSLSDVARGLAMGEREGRSLLERIEWVEMEALRNLRTFSVPLFSLLMRLRRSPQLVGILVIFTAVVTPARLAIIASTILRWVFLFFLSSGILPVITLCSFVSRRYNIWQRDVGNPGDRTGGAENDNANRGDVNENTGGAARQIYEIDFGNIGIQQTHHFQQQNHLETVQEVDHRTEEEMVAEAIERSLQEY